MIDYRKPTILDIAPMEMELLETRAGHAGQSPQSFGKGASRHSLTMTSRPFSRLSHFICPP